MTHGTFAALFAVLVTGVACFETSLAQDTGPATSATTAAVGKSESAEVCSSLDGKILTVRGFGDTLGTLVVYNPDPTKRPAVKEGFTFKKEAGGVTRKNDVSLEMFELMAEPLGPESLKPRAQWKQAYEILFDGPVTIIDDKAKTIGTMPMTCAAAMVDYL